MFATSGYFKGVDCPYFLSGLCERPYCHLRHVKKDNGRDASSGYVGGSRPSSPLDSALGQCSGPTGSKPVGSSNYLTKTGPTGSISATNTTACAAKIVEEYSVEEEASSDGPSYEPTPKYEVAGKTKRKISTDCLYQPGGPAVEVPEYEPNHVPGSVPNPTAEYRPGSVPKFSNTTPDRYVPSVTKVSKPQAKKRRANPPKVPDVIPEYVPSAVAQYNPTPITQLKKMKKIADTDLEYDPVNNYMCNANPAEEGVGEVVYVPTKRPKLEEEDDIGDSDNGMCMDLNDFGDSDDAKFSSDDNNLDESELIMDSGRYESPLEEDSDDEEVSEIFSVKPFFRDTSVNKSNDVTKEKEDTDICENELKHPIRKPVLSQKSESEQISSDKSKQKSEQGDKSKSDTKMKEKSEKSSKHSSQSSSQKSSLKDSNGKSFDSSKQKDSSTSKSSKSMNGSHGNKHKSSESSKHKSSSSSSKSSEKKIDISSATQGKSSKHSEKDKSKHKETDLEKHKDSSNKSDKDGSKSSSAEKKHKSDSHKTHSSSQSKSRSSSKDNSHRKEHHKDSKEKLKDSENRKSKDRHSKSSSSSHSSSSRDGHGAHKPSSTSSKSHSHSSKSGSKSEKENKNKNEKSKSSSSKSSKDKSVRKEEDKDLADINVDLFGSESEEEEVSNSNNNAQEMTDAELAMFLEDSDFESDTDTFEECLKIFNEDGPSFSKLKSEKKKDVKSSETAVIPGKKRMAHANDSRPSKSAAPKGPVRMSAAQVMHNRLLEMQRRALEAAEARKAVAEAQASTSSSTSHGSGKRQAHVPKSKSSVGRSLNDRDEDKRTVAITVARGQKRTAHAPTISNVKRPTIPAEFGGKVPSNIRQRYLNLIIDECLKICKTEEEAYNKGQEEESAVYKRATNKNIYLRVAVNAIKRLRVEAEQAHPSPTKSSPSKVIKQSHEAVLGGKNATKTTYTLHRSGGGNKNQTDDFKGAELYHRLSKYMMTEEQLKENGYPRPSSEGGSKAAFYKDRNDKDVILKPHEKNCVRCGKRFIVFPNGNYNREEECVYHWGKAWKKRVDRALVTSYNCCGGDLEAEGCQVCKCHVYESNKSENVTGYMKTIPSSPPIDGDYGVYAMDCEMVYTKGGMELARVTVIDSVCTPVYEALVKPDFPVIDYNTRFSGLTEENLKGVKTTLRDVQAVLLSLFTDKSILIGHSLESDLISVKLIHNTVVDTSVVFPHRLGPPYKRALRNLMSDFLKKIIQDDVGGHDSQEDALACLQLMQWKLKEDAKKEIRRI